MRRSSTVRRRVAVALAFLAPVLLAEIAIQGLMATHRLPFAEAHRPDFEVTWANLARQAPVDVLILGDSVSQQGIEPAVLERLIYDETSHEVTVFNAASPGGGLGVNASIIQQLRAEGRLPPVIIVGVYSGTLSTDATFRDIFSRTVMGRIFTACDVPMPLVEVPDCQLSRVSGLWRWRGRLGDVVRAVQEPIPTTDETDALHLRSDGFREGRGRGLAHLQRQLGRADLDRRLFTFPEEVRASWARLVAAARGSKLVPVAIPDTPPMRDRMEELQPGREQTYWDAVRILATDARIPFVMVKSFGDWWGDGMARNFNHLSRDGAVHFTEQLWETPGFRDWLLGGLDLRP
jgi:hypothetical protein